MKKNFKWMTLALAACGAFLGCSGDNGPSTFQMDDSFDIVLTKASYVYKSRDSLLIVKNPVCREVKDGGLKYLEWKKETSRPDSMIAYSSKAKAYLAQKDGDDEEVYRFEGKSFPKGDWIEDSQNSIHYAKSFYVDELKEVFQYDGNCFMKSFYSQLFKKNVALKDAEKAVANFYMMFSEDKDVELDEDEIVDNLRAPECDEISMHDGEVSIRLDKMKESSGKILLSYRGKSCPISFSLRYANSQGDCRAAYDEFKLDRNAADNFDFGDYNKTVDYSYNCVSELVQSYRKDKGTLKKQASLDDEDEARLVATSAVNLILSGLKK